MACRRRQVRATPPRPHSHGPADFHPPTHPLTHALHPLPLQKITPCPPSPPLPSGHRCPHRLAPLSEGRVDAAGRLECPYHGWSFNGDGSCHSIPQEQPGGRGVSATQSPRACATSYMTQVSQGAGKRIFGRVERASRACRDPCPGRDSAAGRAAPQRTKNHRRRRQPLCCLLLCVLAPWAASVPASLPCPLGSADPFLSSIQTCSTSSPWRSRPRSCPRSRGLRFAPTAPARTRAHACVATSSHRTPPTAPAPLSLALPPPP